LAPQQPPPQDPITGKSLASWLLVAALLLIAVLGWSLYREEFGLRPWRSYQSRFSRVYSAYLQKRLTARRAAEKQLAADGQYKKLEAAVRAAEKVARPQDAKVEQQIQLADAQRESMLTTFQTVRSYVGSLTYNYAQVPETAGYKSEKQSRLRELQKAREEKHEIEWPTADGKVEKRMLNYEELNGEFNRLLNEKAGFMQKRGEIDAPVKAAQDKLTAYVSKQLPGLNAAQLVGLLNKARSLEFQIHQIYVNPPGKAINYLGGGSLVDRCQSCHLGMDPAFVPAQMELTKADLGLAKSKNAPFTSHPQQVLLRLHPLQEFGCSTCHGGNGRALDSVKTAHGRYEHWPWPLTYPENVEAGCQNCHAADAYTDYAPVLNRGRYLFRVKGCIGCHKYGGFDNQSAQLESTEHLIQNLERQKKDNVQEAAALNDKGDTAASNEAAQNFYAEATNLTVRNAKIGTRVDVLDSRVHDLMQEVKKVGPNLKEVRMKLHPDWIPYWIAHTHEFDPHSQMPQFRLEPEQVKAISAFIWQDGLKGPLPPKQRAGDPVHGKQLFMERGCLACHSIGEGASRMGGDFAANLSRVGEKDKYDYLVRWIHNPRVRTAPYCPYEHRDLTPADYAKHGLPYVFDAQHSKCPNDGHELEYQNPTVMPSFRLSWQDARDVASFLETQKTKKAYAAAPWMNDPKLYGKGKALVQFYGCAGCHEISGLEDQGRIGTELTSEGSKPIDRLDFGFLMTKAQEGILPDGKESKRGSWYTRKGFFEHKLVKPNIFDTQRYLPNPEDRLHMPTPALSHNDIEALTTFLLGSVDSSTLPPYYIYKPKGEAAAIQKGWWIVTKYNCIGCHQIGVGQPTVLEKLPMYQGENAANLPPVLTFEGARVQPKWLKEFLANPALSTTDTDRNGVRGYLQVRMPTFYLSPDEISTLVSFFEALSSQPLQYMPPEIKPLTPAETRMAREIFTSNAAPCLKCHMTGVASHDKNASAPNFLMARERLRPDWTREWMIAPATMAPGTAMPSNLFRKENGRWIFNGPLPPDLKNYKGDMAELLVRYMFELSPQEQRMLLSRTPSGGGQ
jgi:cytochrome c551/c552